MALTINFIGSHAAIKHLNLRKQGNEDDRVLAIDIKLSGEVQSGILSDLLGASPGEDLSTLFWSTGTDPEQLRTYALADITVDAEWPRRIVHLGKHRTTGDMKKIHFTPRPGHRLDLTAQISINGPTQALLDYLVKNIQENIVCSIESQPELDLDDEAKRPAPQKF